MIFWPLSQHFTAKLTVCQCTSGRRQDRLGVTGCSHLPLASPTSSVIQAILQFGYHLCFSDHVEDTPRYCTVLPIAQSKTPAYGRCFTLVLKTQSLQDQALALWRRRKRVTPTPARPIPNSIAIPGSGTSPTGGGGSGVARRCYHRF